FGEYDESAAETAELVAEFAQSGFVNIVGGCCGTTPEHIRAIAEAVKDIAPRQIPDIPRACRLSGLEPFTIDRNSLFVNVGERTNIPGSARPNRLTRVATYTEAPPVAPHQQQHCAEPTGVRQDAGGPGSVNARVPSRPLAAG